MKLIRPALIIAAMVFAAGGLMACSFAPDPSPDITAGSAAATNAGGVEVGHANSGDSVEPPSAGEPPTVCPADPGLSLVGGWETTTEEQNFQVSHQCTYTVGNENAGDVFNLFVEVIPRPSGLEGPAVAAFGAAPCDGDDCQSASSLIESGAVVRAVEPNDNSVAIFVDNPGKIDFNGTDYEWFDATAWFVTEDNLCSSDLGGRMSTYDPAIVDTLLDDLQANAATACGVTLS